MSKLEEDNAEQAKQNLLTAASALCAGGMSEGAYLLALAYDDGGLW